MFLLLDNKENWDQKIISQGGDFLQSWQWSEFQKSIGQKVIGQEIAGVPVQIIKYPLPLRQSYLYASHIQIKSSKLKVKSDRRPKFLTDLKAVVKKEKSVFLRVDFLIEKEMELVVELQQALQETKFRPAPKNYYFSAVSQSPFVAHLDISGHEEQILSNMRYNTRRSIRLAKDRGVVVKQSENIESFFNLLMQTGQRKNVGLHPREHYFKLKQAFGNDLILLLAYNERCHCEECITTLNRCTTWQSQSLNYHKARDCHAAALKASARNDKLLAGAMILFFGDQATYLHAGSLPGSQNQEAPYLILWRAICEAKKRGCKIFDLGAIAPQGSENHSWQSITTFKMGWRPRAVNYLPAYDWVNKKLWYKLYCWKKNLK